MDSLLPHYPHIIFLALTFHVSFNPQVVPDWDDWEDVEKDVQHRCGRVECSVYRLTSSAGMMWAHKIPVRDVQDFNDCFAANYDVYDV